VGVYNILKIGLRLFDIIAFINVRVKAPLGAATTAHMLHHRMFKPAHERDPGQLPVIFSVQPQKRPHNPSLRLSHKYLLPYSGMVKYMNASITVYVYSLVLLDRAQEFNPTFKIHRKNIHRLLLASNVVAVKYLDDMFYKNSFYANVGGVSLKVLN
jgi:hypothetical protein